MEVPMAVVRSDPVPPIEASPFLVRGHFAIAPIEEITRYVGAGDLRFGVEPRILTTEITAANRLAHGQPPPEREHDDAGVSIHVYDAATNDELLRFDCFREEPHYHYFLPDSTDFLLVNFDEIAGGPMLDWVFDILRTRLSALLAQTGASALADRLDQEALEEGIDDCEAVARGLIKTPA
jgi:hypothetical protein